MLAGGYISEEKLGGSYELGAFVGNLVGGVAGAKAYSKVANGTEAIKSAKHTTGTSNAQPQSSTPVFSEKDLVYGPSANGNLRAFQQQSGGRLLTDVGGPCSGETWAQFSVRTMNNQILSGGKIRFDLTYMDDLTNILNGNSVYSECVTTRELLYIKGNWSRFSNHVTFYLGNLEVPAPW